VFVVVHGARYSWDLGYRTELTGLARHCSNFHYMPVITRPQEDATWKGKSGYLQNLIASGAIEEETGLALTPENFDIFLCGNPGMIETVIHWAEERGFTRDKDTTSARSIPRNIGRSCLPDGRLRRWRLRCSLTASEPVRSAPRHRLALDSPGQRMQ